MSGNRKAKKRLSQIITKARKAADKAEKAAIRAEKALRKVKNAKSKIKGDVDEINKKHRTLKKSIQSYVKDQSKKAIKKNNVQKKIRKQQG